MDSAKGRAPDSEVIKQALIAEPKVREMVVLFLLGAISLGTVHVLAFSLGVGSTREFRISYTISTPQNDRNRQIKKSIQTAGEPFVYVLAVALPPFLMIGASLSSRAQCSTRSKLVCWAVVFFVFGAIWWCSYRFGAHVGKQLPDWAI